MLEKHSFILCELLATVKIKIVTEFLYFNLTKVFLKKLFQSNYSNMNKKILRETKWKSLIIVFIKKREIEEQT